MSRTAFLISPGKVTGEIRRFCQGFSSRPPMVVKAVPFPGCEGESAAILPEHVQRFGGSAHWGWRIVAWPRIVLLAEPHPVWLSPKQEWIDVCPSADRAPHSLFVAAEDETQAPAAAQRMALVQDRDVQAWLDVSLNPASSGADAMDLFLRVVRKYNKPNDPCWCGSGKPMRKCHGTGIPTKSAP